jgi:predicted PurR-regulated permease PerM
MSTIKIDEKFGQWTAGQIIGGTLLILGIGLGFWLLYRLYFVFFSLLVAIMLHIAIKPAVEALHRRGIRKELGVILMYTVLFLLAVGFFVLLVPILAEQMRTIGSLLPAYYPNLRDFLQNSDIALLPILGKYLPAQLTLSQMPLPTAQGASGAASSPWLIVGNAGEAIFIAVSVFIMAFYWTLDRDRIVYTLLMRVSMERREDLRTLISDIEEKVGAFYRGQLILCTMIGGLSLLAYWLIGLPYAVALGVFAFVLEAVPMLGPILAAVPAVLIALAVVPERTIWVIIAVVVIQVVESNVLVPRVMDKTVGLNAMVSILAIATFTLVFGIVGALLAIPLAAILQILINRLLFKTAVPEAPIDSIHEIDSNGARGHSGVLRLAAQDLAQDVRKRLRNEDAKTAASVQGVEAMIETYATDLDSLLAQWGKISAAGAATERAIAGETTLDSTERAA